MLLITFLLSVLTLQQQPKPQIIDGYPGTISAYPGDSLSLYLNATHAETSVLSLADLSGNIVHTFQASVFPQTRKAEKAYETGFGYRRTCAFKIPSALKSGIYLVEGTIPIVVKSRGARITIIYPSNTINAYSASGGKSLYGFNSFDNKGAHIVSFHRPMGLPRHAEAFFRWIHEQRFEDVGYVADVDLDDYKNISKSKLLIVAGHSEYWTFEARRSFDRFVQGGKHALVLSGNTMWWQVRFNKGKDQLICYRDANIDPGKNPRTKTINWFDPSLNYPIVSSIGAEFRNGGYGVRYPDAGWDGFKIVVNSPLLEGTSVKINDIIKCPSDELDGVPLSSFQNNMPIVDYGKTNFSRIEIIGYDRVVWAGKEGIATWIVFKPTALSGIVINTGSTDWCSDNGIGSNNDIKTITRTMIRRLLNDENVFSIDITANNVAN